MKFLNFFKTGLGIFIIVLIILAIILISMNWTAIKAWWNDETTSQRVSDSTILNGINQRAAATQTLPVFDDYGNYTGENYIVTGSTTEKKKVACQKVTNPQGYTGWIGDCKFPIGSN